jgi:phage terminase small subunit
LKAEDAAIRAGYSKSIARTKSHQWLAKDSKLYKPLLAEFIQSKLIKKVEKLEKNEEDVIKELVKLGFANISSLVDIKKGSVIVKDLSELTEAQQVCIESISETRDGIRVKFYDKIKPFELLGKHFGVISDKVDHTVTLKKLLLDI